MPVAPSRGSQTESCASRPAFERAEHVVLNECARCGQVTTGTLCAFCKLADQVKRRG